MDQNEATILTPEQMARLPKYARDEIERLLLNARYWQNKATAGPETSDTFAGGGLEGKGGRPLGMGERIHFRTDTGWIEAHLTPVGKLRVSSGDTILVIPHATNSIEIEPRNRWA